MIRICESCGQEFEGGPRTLHCPSCKAKRRKESQKRYNENRRQRTGRAKREKIKVDDTQCRTCEYGKKGIYVNRNQYMCDYWSITGKLRLCEPSPNCEKYKPRKRGKRE